MKTKNLIARCMLPFVVAGICASASPQCFLVTESKFSLQPGSRATSTSNFPNQYMEAAIVEGHRQLNELLGMETGLRWSSEFNAWADPKKNEVVFGTEIVMKAMRNNNNNVTRSLDAGGFVLAHEFSHHLQFREYGLPWFDTHPNPVPELMADMIGGYMLTIVVPEWQQQTMDSYGTALAAAFYTGDNNFGDPQHHGTSAERRSAAMAGMRAGMANKFGKEMDDWGPESKAYAWAMGEITRILGSQEGVTLQDLSPPSLLKAWRTNRRSSY